MHSNDESINYWPGFVDAIMNVLLNILFMLCIMAFGLGMVQNQVRQSVNTSDDGDNSNPGRAAKKGGAHNSSEAESDNNSDADNKPLKGLPPPLNFPTQETINTFPVSQIKLKNPALPDPNASTSETSVTAKLSEQNILSLHFTRQSPGMLQEIKAHLKTYLPQVASPDDDIVVWAVDSEEMRNANKLLFTRLMVVRNVLVDSGIPSNRIEVRMLPGETSKNDLTVYLASSAHSP